MDPLLAQHKSVCWIHFLKPEITHILFIDVDEIIDRERFSNWLQNFEVNNYAAIRFLSYFYFRTAAFRARSHSQNGLLLKREAISSPETILTIYERKGLFDVLAGSKLQHVVGVDGLPLVHHYSWVKEPEELFQKVKSWGHHAEKDWSALLKEELSRTFTGIDALYGLSYDRVEPLHDPFAVDIAYAKKEASYLEQAAFTNVQKVSWKQLQLLQLNAL